MNYEDENKKYKVHLTWGKWDILVGRAELGGNGDADSMAHSKNNYIMYNLTSFDTSPDFSILLGNALKF